MDEEVAPLKPQVYVDPRPAEHFAPFHDHARRRGPDWVYDLARIVSMPVCALLYRTRCFEMANVPQRGPAILAPNHFSAMDHFFCGVYLRRRIRFMAKSQLYVGPLKWILRHGGAFPVRRGAHDDEAIVTAERILAAGGIVVIYPEGGRSRTATIGRRARHGIGRVALATGAPVIPVAIHGSLHARNWTRLRFPRVSVQYGQPLHLGRVEGATREQQQAVADDVLAAVRTLYAELARRRRAPLHWPREQTTG
jgi:1-acyl-sn-glycerol-3-phosphate acyltransferase